MHVLGIANHSTYYKLLEDLEEFGAIKLLEKGRNQHEAPIVALVIFAKATTKQLQSNVEADMQADSGQCIHNQTIQTIKPNKQTKENTGETSSPSPPKSSLKDTLPQREYEFKRKCCEFIPAYNLQMIQEFFSWWSEKNKTETKMKWELERTFEIGKRLATWAKREKEFKNNKTTQNEYTPRISKTEWEAKTGQKYLGQDDPNA